MSDPTWTPAMLAANFESMRLLYLQAEAERNAATQRAEDAEAKLALVDEYGQSQWNSGVSGGEFEAGPYETFAEWLAQREELL